MNRGDWKFKGNNLSIQTYSNIDLESHIVPWYLRRVLDKTVFSSIQILACGFVLALFPVVKSAKEHARQAKLNKNNIYKNKKQIYIYIYIGARADFI